MKPIRPTASWVVPLGDLKEMVQAVEQYEKHIQSASEASKLTSTVTSEASLRRYREYARATLSKSNRVNTRLSTPDLSEIQARAAESDIPYQILITSILHKFLAGRFIEKSSRLMTRDSGRGKKRRDAPLRKARHPGTGGGIGGKMVSEVSASRFGDEERG